MKRALSAALIFSALSGSAFAADFSEPPTPIAPTIFPDWNGVYFGINGGGGDASARWQYHAITAGTTFGSAGLLGSGGVIGGTVGYNREFPIDILDFPTYFVGGLEGDWDWASISANTICPVISFSCESNISDLGTVRGRLGWAFDRILLYGTGGFAWGDVNSRTIQRADLAEPPSGTSVNGSKATHFGWAAGAGLEYAFWSWFTLKLEWIHYDLGPASIAVDNPTSYTVSAHEKGDLFRAGLNFKFDLLGPPPPPPGPVIAKY